MTIVLPLKEIIHHYSHGNLSKNFNIAKKKWKIQILKFLKDQKILKNKMIHYLEIIKTKQYIYIYIYIYD